MERIPCIMKDTDACPVYLQEGECYEDKHHKYWPSPEYTTPTEKRFRLLGKNVIKICRYVHNTIHAVTPPPAKPPVAEMRKRIYGPKRN